jgi:hypothetical protein
MDNNGFCCASFRDLIHEAGSKGFAIVPFKNPLERDDYVYFLQSRSVDFEDQMSRHITVDMTIGYCPFCGTKLTEVTRMNKEAIEAIAEKDRKFIQV